MVPSLLGCWTKADSGIEVFVHGKIKQHLGLVFDFRQDSPVSQDDQ